MWYNKKKDIAVATSFGQHVLGGYRFLMQIYDEKANDDIYMFGFSRGAYTAIVLLDMLQNIGLLRRGNDELAQFAWMVFSEWQCRPRHVDASELKKTKLRLHDFQETFSRPVARIRFLGLFDAVNSVPRFESSYVGQEDYSHPLPRVGAVRHALSIDERRTRFRPIRILAPHKNDVQEVWFAGDHADVGGG